MHIEFEISILSATDYQKFNAPTKKSIIATSHHTHAHDIRTIQTKTQKYDNQKTYQLSQAIYAQTLLFLAFSLLLISIDIFYMYTRYLPSTTSTTCTNIFCPWNLFHILFTNRFSLHMNRSYGHRS